jgi:hypothetical protein
MFFFLLQLVVNTTRNGDNLLFETPHPKKRRKEKEKKVRDDLSAHVFVVYTSSKSPWAYIRRHNISLESAARY